MYNIHPDLKPKCRVEDGPASYPLQLGSSGNIRPCNYYGARINYKHLEAWASDKGFDLTKLNIRNSTMKQIYESDVFKALLEGHKTLDLPMPCLEHCRAVDPKDSFGYKVTDKGFNNE